MADVPSDEDVAIFFPEDQWNSEEGRPHRVAFQASDRVKSSWHENRLMRKNKSTRDLCTGKFEGWWEALLTPDEVAEAASCVLDRSGKAAGPKVSVYFDPSGANGDLSSFDYAHANIETDSGDTSFPRTMRTAMAEMCRVRDATGNTRR